MGEMNVDVIKPATRSDLAVIRLSGIVDALTLPDLEKTLHDLMGEKRFNIVVNCQKLKFISSSGMGLFLGILGEVEKQGGAICFSQVLQPEVHDAMNLLGFFDIFPLYNQEVEAVQQCRQRT